MVFAAWMLLVDGWSQAGCLTARGRGCHHEDEAAHTFDLYGAVYATVETPDEANALWAALDGATDGYALTWSMVPGRTHAEVVTAVAGAVERAEKEEAS